VKPLREQTDAADATERAAASLLANVSPLEPSTSRMRRVRVRIAEGSRFRIMPLLRTAAIGAVLLAGVTASAMAGRAIFAGSKQDDAQTVSPVNVPSPLAPKARVVAPPKAPEIVEPTAPEAESVPDVVDANGSTAANRSTRNVAPAASNPGAKLMMQAMKARRDGDTARAAELLKEYRRKYPAGTLQEEALALSIEAAATRGDAANASRLARQYLDRYPQGRFKEQAQRVLRSSP
jgi:TolA-binding protein